MSSDIENRKEVSESGISNSVAECPVGSVPPVSLGLDLTGSRVMSAVAGGEKGRVDKRDLTDEIDWPPYHWIDVPVKQILDDFWEVKYDQSDIEKHELFIKMLRMEKERLSYAAIGKALKMSNVDKYLIGQRMSFVTHLRAEHERLGQVAPQNKLLPLYMKPRGIPDRDWVQVPVKIRTFSDIESVLDRLTPTEDSYVLMKEFGYQSREEVMRDRSDHFMFFMGGMLGDAAKDPRDGDRFPSTKVQMTLSMAKPNGHRFNQFMALGANNALGLQMHRIRDQPPSTSGGMTRDACFRWITPVSPLLTWVFQVVMGYEKGELTTYNKMRADWLIEAPRRAKVHFLQGLAESDGWVNPGRDQVRIVASPNEQLLDSLLNTLEVPHRFDHEKVNIVAFGTEDGIKLPAFNERIRSNYYEEMQIMANAKRFTERSPLDDWFLQQIHPILLNCPVYDRACLEIARKTGYKINNNTVKKYVLEARK
jgi:hypothetical protein